MGWPDREQMARAVLDVLKTNLGLKSGEKLPSSLECLRRVA